MPLNNALEQLCSYKNLFWAWRKVAVFCQTSDTWYNETEYRLFELNLRENLLSIASDFAQSHYQTAPLRPLPQPKRDSQGKITVRQAFWVAIRDQVAWLAYTNVVGPEIDGLMPAWSYGNRLYRSITFADVDAGKRKMSVGPYRHSRGLTYRPWKQSWPLYRRHLLLTARRWPDQSLFYQRQTNAFWKLRKVLSRLGACLTFRRISGRNHWRAYTGARSILKNSIHLFHSSLLAVSC